MLFDHLIKPGGRKRAEQADLLNAIGQFVVHNFCMEQNFKTKCSFCSPKLQRYIAELKLTVILVLTE